MRCLNKTKPKLFLYKPIFVSQAFMIMDIRMILGNIFHSSLQELTGIHVFEKKDRVRRIVSTRQEIGILYNFLLVRKRILINFAKETQNHIFL